MESGLENMVNDDRTSLIESQKSDHGQLVKQIMETQKVLGNQDAGKNEAVSSYVMLSDTKTN